MPHICMQSPTLDLHRDAHIHGQPALNGKLYGKGPAPVVLTVSTAVQPDSVLS